MTLTKAAVQRIVDEAARYLIEHEDATVSDGITYGMFVEHYAHGTGTHAHEGIHGYSPLTGENGLTAPHGPTGGSRP